MANLTLYLGDVAQVTGNNMNIITGTKLNIADAPTSAQNAANMGYVDLKVKEVQDALNLVTAGAGPSFDTLVELKNIADNVLSSGISDLASESASRVSADSSLESRLSAEESVSRAAQSSLTSRVSAEESVSRAAEISLTSRVSSEEVARDAADDRLETLTLRSSTTLMYVPQVYADSTTLPTPLEQCNYHPLTAPGGFDGWRMKNTVAGTKFNLYVPSTGLTIGDVKALYLETCTPSVTSMPFITIYTKPIPGASNNATYWYRSRITYVNNSTNVRVANSVYNMVANLKNISNVYSSNYLTQHNMVPTTVSDPPKDRLDLVLDTDEIYAFSIGSDSGAAVGNVECIIGKFKVQLDSGIHEFVFSNQHVFTAYMQRKNEELWNALYGTSAADKPFILDYKIPTPARFT